MVTTTTMTAMSTWALPTQTKNDKSEMTITCQLCQQCKKQGWGMPAASQASQSECSRQPQHISMVRSKNNGNDNNDKLRQLIIMWLSVLWWSCSHGFLQLVCAVVVVAAADCSCRVLDCDCCSCWVWLGCCSHWLWLWWSLIVAVAVVDCGCLGCWLLMFCGRWLLLSWSLTAAIMDVLLGLLIVIWLVGYGNREK